MKTNYSHSTSLPAYYDNGAGKQRQMDEIRECIRRGRNNLLQIHYALNLPQSTVAGRVNDLIAAKMAKYDGEVVFEGRKRKRIVLISQAEGEQASLF